MAGVAALAAGVLLATALAAWGRAPSVGRCPVFPPSSPWNQRVDKLPVRADSANMIDTIGADIPLHPDFGSGRWQGGKIGIPYTVVAGSEPAKPVPFSDAAYSDNGSYPIPVNAAVEDRPDRHVVVVDRAACRLYELYEAQWRGFSSPGWRATAGATWDLRSTRLRPDGWTSADAAGLPIFPGLVRYDEVRAGHISHALRLAVPATRRAWVYPARHASSSAHDPRLPAMGQRLRLKASIDPRRFPPQARVVVRALQRYGVMVADEGPVHLTGAPSERWTMSQVYTLERLRAGDFEAVETRSLPRPSP